MTISVKPATAIRSKCHTIKGLPPTTNNGFGVWSVSGRIRSPRPAASIITFINSFYGRFVLLRARSFLAYKYHMSSSFAPRRLAPHPIIMNFCRKTRLAKTYTLFVVVFFPTDSTISVAVSIRHNGRTPGTNNPSPAAYPLNNHSCHHDDIALQKYLVS